MGSVRPALLLLAPSLVALPSASSHHIEARTLTLRYLFSLLLSHSLLSSPPRCVVRVTEHLSGLVTLRSADDAAWLQVKLCYCEGTCDAGRHAICFDHDRSSTNRGISAFVCLIDSVRRAECGRVWCEWVWVC